MCYRFAGCHRIFERGCTSQVERMPKPPRPLALLPGQLPVHGDPSTGAAFKLVDDLTRDIRTRPEAELAFALQAEGIGEVVEVNAENVHRHDEFIRVERTLSILHPGNDLTMFQAEAVCQLLLGQAGSVAGDSEPTTDARAMLHPHKSTIILQSVICNTTGT